MNGRTITVTDLAFECLPRVRDYRIGVARHGTTISYGERRADAALRYRPQGWGGCWTSHEDRSRRGEPSLASLVVNASTREVGDDFAGDRVPERQAAYVYWA